MEILSDSELANVFSLVREVGAKVAEIFHNHIGKKIELKIQQKTDGSFVTEADLWASEQICSRLNQLFPTDGVISEETKRSAELANYRRVWITDPIDGTHSFIDGKDDFSILLGLCIDGEAVFGVMYFPVLQQFLWGMKGRGAYLNEKPLRVSSNINLREHSLRIRGLDLPPSHYIHRYTADTGLSMIRLTEGALDGIVLIAGTMGEWDVAASTAIIEQAGGKVSDEKGRALRFNQEKLSFNYFVASNGHLHDQILAFIPNSSNG